MSRQINFPKIRPASRRYNPGEYPQTEFKSNNGTTEVIRFGRLRVDSSLKLQFKAISETETVEILQHYEKVNSEWNYVRFSKDDAGGGTNTNEMMQYINEAESGLRWRYAKPPEVTGVFDGLNDVTCVFTAFLDAIE